MSFKKEKDSVYIRRLTKLAKFLFNLQDDRFYYGKWVGGDWGGKQDLSCGTTGCALGWCPSIKEFYDLGARLYRFEDGSGLKLRGHSNDFIDRNETSYIVAKKLFGVTYQEYTFLFIPSQAYYDNHGNGYFSPDRDASAKTVSEHIMNFIDLKYNKKVFKNDN